MGEESSVNFGVMSFCRCTTVGEEGDDGRGGGSGDGPAEAVVWTRDRRGVQHAPRGEQGGDDAGGLVGGAPGRDRPRHVTRVASPRQEPLASSCVAFLLSVPARDLGSCGPMSSVASVRGSGPRCAPSAARVGVSRPPAAALVGSRPRALAPAPRAAVARGVASGSTRRMLRANRAAAVEEAPAGPTVEVPPSMEPQDLTLPPGVVGPINRTRPEKDCDRYVPPEGVRRARERERDEKARKRKGEERRRAMNEAWVTIAALAFDAAHPALVVWRGGPGRAHSSFSPSACPVRERMRTRVRRGARMRLRMRSLARILSPCLVLPRHRVHRAFFLSPLLILFILLVLSPFSLARFLPRPPPGVLSLSRWTIRGVISLVGTFVLF